MTSVAPALQPEAPPPTATPTPAIGARPRIAANRRLLVRRFPPPGVAPDFTPDTIDRALGVRSARLKVVAQAAEAEAPTAASAPAAAPAAAAPAPTPAAAPAPTPAPAATPAPVPAQIDPAEDAAAG